jgi:hypothetical protein
MRSLTCIGLLAAVLLTVFVLPAGASSAGTRIDFSSLDTNQPYKCRERSTCRKILQVHARPLSWFTGPWESTHAVLSIDWRPN